MNHSKKIYSKKIVRFTTEVFLYETDIAEKLREVVANGETRQAYIKRLIRNDIKNSKKN